MVSSGFLSPTALLPCQRERRGCVPARALSPSANSLQPKKAAQSQWGCSRCARWSALCASLHRRPPHCVYKETDHLIGRSQRGKMGAIAKQRDIVHRRALSEQLAAVASLPGVATGDRQKLVAVLK